MKTVLPTIAINGFPWCFDQQWHAAQNINKQTLFMQCKFYPRKTCNAHLKYKPQITVLLFIIQILIDWTNLSFYRQGYTLKLCLFLNDS